ncbi:MAG TPA: prepilin-type N-terminal cleavage/methylation domain-containing protein [Pirellulales bacterium]|nr:prepilin-type N-terminal cleavage/methylation domain-containing protein [Pirellulales bacterium]
MNLKQISTGAVARLRFRASTAAPRRGFTLIEMMVVILLVTLLTSIMIPVLSAASDSRRAREGARVLSTMLATAQTQAEVSGRPAAVWIQRLKNSTGAVVNSSAAMELYLAEVPPPYLGDTLTSTASINGSTVTFSNASLTNANVQAGDVIRFSYRGESFYLSNINGNSATIAPLDPTQTYPPGASLPFQIYRRPIKSAASAVQLSDGVAIDLEFSGADFNSSMTGFNNPFTAGAGDAGQIIITFAPTGSLDLVYIVSSTASTQVFRPVSGVYLLIGRIDSIPIPPATTPTSPNQFNWQDFNSRWVAVGRQSGLVTTSEVASAATGTTANVITSLRLARSSQNTGGN